MASAGTTTNRTTLILKKDTPDGNLIDAANHLEKKALVHIFRSLGEAADGMANADIHKDCAKANCVLYQFGKFVADMGPKEFAHSANWILDNFGIEKAATVTFKE
eukprot:895485_1